jgi:hypothetical protein
MLISCVQQIAKITTSEDPTKLGCVTEWWIVRNVRLTKWLVAHTKFHENPLIDWNTDTRPDDVINQPFHTRESRLKLAHLRGIDPQPVCLVTLVCCCKVWGVSLIFIRNGIYARDTYKKEMSYLSWLDFVIHTHTHWFVVVSFIHLCYVLPSLL